MRMKKYEVFVKVAELQSFTKAAAALGYTQSGVSQIVSGLEEELGFSVFTRGRGGARLTDAGSAIYPQMRAVVEAQNRLTEAIEAVRGLESGTVRIGAFTSVAVHWLPRMLKDFEKTHPHIKFKLLNGDYHDVEQWLAEGEVDLGFVNLPNSLDCRCVPLVEDSLLAVMPRNHRLAVLNRLPVAAVQNEDFIGLLENSDHDARRTLEAAGITPNIKFTTKDDYAIIAMVEQGLGISIMPKLLLQGRDGNVRTMELEPRASRTIALAIPAESEKRPAAQSFAEHICTWVRENAEGIAE